MLTAQTKDGQSITLALLSKKAIREVRERETFYCPSCRDPVIVKAGEVMTPHFAHLYDSNCPSQHGGESEYHHKGKLLLYEWLLNQKMDVTLEEYIPQVQQRPDLLLRLQGRLIAIEFQCATIDKKIIYQRNAGYQRAHIVPIWILGANQLTRLTAHHIQINSFTLSLLHRFSPNYPTMLFYFCPQTKQFSFIRDLLIITKSKALAQQTYIPLSECSFYDFFKRKYFTKETLIPLWQKEKRAFRLQSRTGFGQERAWLNWLYNQQMYIDYLPAYIFLPIRSQYTMSVPLWNWQSRFILDFFGKLEIGAMFSIEAAEQFLRKYRLPRVDEQLIRTVDRPVLEYLHALSSTGLVEQVDEDYYRKLQQPTPYKHIEQALDGDAEFLHHFMYNRTQMNNE